MAGRIIALLLALLLILGIPQSPEGYGPIAHASTGKILSEETYRHLDMGVQLVYFDGAGWEDGYSFGTGIRSNITTKLRFSEELQVIDVYPLESDKGRVSYDFHEATSTHNIPGGLGNGEDAYHAYYSDFASGSIQIDSFSDQGAEVTFQYDAGLWSKQPLEVFEYGEAGQQAYIYSLFGGEAKLKAEQPLIHASVKNALELGASGQGGAAKLYLIFCPNVIEYRKYVEPASLMAQLQLPTMAKTGENYTVSDISKLDSSLMVTSALLERRREGEPAWEPLVTWVGAERGQHTGGSRVEMSEEIGEITYRLTVAADNGATDFVEKTIYISDGREMLGKARLALQPITYEGHPAWAMDESTFSVNTVSYSALQFYREGLGVNGFQPESGAGAQVKRKSQTQAEIIFPRRGVFAVDLKVNLINNTVLRDTQTIEVKKTPTILESLGGTQKQNRRQELAASVAICPGNPLVEYSIELTNLVTGEHVRLDQDTPLNNGVALKTRNVSWEGSFGESEQENPYWTNFTLEFLTKIPQYREDLAAAGITDQSQSFRYRIWVKDSKGEEDLVEKTFKVEPDQPPVPSLLMQATHLREPGSNMAILKVEDKTTTDGDQVERTWWEGGMPAEGRTGFQDYSFGSRQQVGIPKEGVGMAEIGLDLKERWVEATLPEYVTEEDYLTASISRETEVINIPPVVSLRPVKSKEAKVYISATPDQLDLFRENVNWMKKELLEKGIYSDIQLIQRASEDTGMYREEWRKSWPSAMWCPGACRETGAVYDSNYAYTVQSNSRVTQNYSQVCNGTHAVYADSVDGTQSGWNYTVSQSSNFYVETDQKEKYIYLVCRDAEKTILLDRDTGAELAVLPVSLAGKIFLNEDNVIFLAQEEAIWRYDLKQNKLVKICQGGSLIQMLEGTISFVGKNTEAVQGNRFYLGQLDMETGVLSGRALPEIPAEGIQWSQGGKFPITPMDMDSLGRVLFVQSYGNSMQKTIQNTSLWVADSKAQKVQGLELATPMTSVYYPLKGLSAGFVKDAKGQGSYVYASYHEEADRSPVTVKWKLKLLGPDPDSPEKLKELMETYRQQNTLNYKEVSYARIHEEEGKIYLFKGNEFQGSEWGGNQSGERMTITIPGYVKGESVSEWDMADEEAFENEYLSSTYSFKEQWLDPVNRVRIFKNFVTKEQAVSQSVSQHVKTGSGNDAFVFSDLDPNTESIRLAVEEIQAKILENSSMATGISMENLEGAFRRVHLKPEATYDFEYEIWTSPGGITKSFESKLHSGGTWTPASFTHHKKVAGKLDFNWEDWETRQDFYTCTTSSYLEGREGFGAGYYGKTNQPKSYSFKIKLSMEEEGHTEFDFFNYFGYQSAGGWSVLVDGAIYDTGMGSQEDHRTVFLEPGDHEITFSGWVTSGYTGYIGISQIKTLYHQESPQVFQWERIETGDAWDRGRGMFSVPSEPFFNRTRQIKGGMLKETFAGNKVALTEYVGFEDSGDYTGCFWEFDGNAGAATLKSTYQAYADGSFRIQAPLSSHLVVSYKEELAYPRVPVTTTLTGDGRRIGDNMFFIPAGGSFSRNYFLERGRNGGYGTVKLSNIQIIPVSASIPSDSIFGKHGAARLNLDTRSRSFHTIQLLTSEEGYLWESYHDLEAARKSQESVAGFFIQNLPEAGKALVRNLKIRETFGKTRLLMMQEPFKQLETVVENGWNPLPPGESLKLETLYSQEPAEPDLVYKKGERVSFQIHYRDYESDPSKREYWRYTHVPFNDGPHPEATPILEDGSLGTPGPVLSGPIQRFYIDGKYTVDHWQEDNTSRSQFPVDLEGAPLGNPSYDKLSNLETRTFYVEGSSEAPWIESIHVGEMAGAAGGTAGPDSEFLRKKVEAGMDFALQIRVDDQEKDVLNLTTEVYKDGRSLFSHYQEGIMAEGNLYSPITIPYVRKAEPGTYHIVCTVRDETGVGLGSASFLVAAIGNIEGKVGHAEEWDKKRKAFNLVRPTLGDPESPREAHVFWPGEAFMLKSEVAGAPIKVTCEILGYITDTGVPRYQTTMNATGMKNLKGESIYEGEIWHKDMIHQWGGKTTLPLTFRFRSVYPQETKTDDVQVILDNREPFLLLHRVW